LEKLRATLSSYWGHFIHADSSKLRLSILKDNLWLNEYFELNNKLVFMQSAQFEPRYQSPKLWYKVADQYNYYQEKFKDIVVLFEVGQYIEFYQELNKNVLMLLNLRRLKYNKRGALYGFPKKALNRYKDILEKSGYNWVTIHETGKIICRIKVRLLFEQLKIGDISGCK
jgi:hypothetical protein